ncbi:YciI family protein [Novosphingobium olei]|uniref:YCII-related domain-containing protein n=1 Tax=Novosphingobium olei TaxID=2728851 RepID=A0A7Y0BMA1_9SPHN|nr:hypothetical protein [Novosphingobium olei]
MNDYILLMHDDGGAETGAAWAEYFSRLGQSGRFDGGSAIGAGRRYRKTGGNAEAPLPLTGFIRIRAESLAEAETFLAGNPVYETGGTVEIRELPRD